jgi:rubrerythrin
MGIIDDAIALETRAEDIYRNAAKTTPDLGARKILELLADEEAQHAGALREMGEAKELRGPNLTAAAREWVRGAVEGGEATISSDAGLIEVLRRAMDIEQTTEAFYREHGKEATDPRVVGLFAKLAEIENEHFHFVSSLVEYYDRPNEWIESAEFGLRPEY